MWSMSKRVSEIVGQIRLLRCSALKYERLLLDRFANWAITDIMGPEQRHAQTSMNATLLRMVDVIHSHFARIRRGRINALHARAATMAMDIQDAKTRHTTQMD